MYVPKLLKLRDDTKEAVSERSDNQKRILLMVKTIALALCEWHKNGKKKFDSHSHQERFQMKPHQKIRIEDLLQIFVDDLQLSKLFLTYVVEDLSMTFNDLFEDTPNEMTQINLHHRLLELMLYSQ